MKNNAPVAPANDSRQPVAVIVGTRPEAVKMAPVIRALAASATLRPVTINTAQHRQMVVQIFRDFEIQADVDLRVMRPRQTLWGLTARLSEKLGDFFARHPVAAVLVQGDTTSAFVGGLAAFYHQIPLGHVEAGLRSGDLYSPFPEEANRSLIGRLARWHFAPTDYARQNLLAEGVPKSHILVTGNTVVDALHWMIGRLPAAEKKPPREASRQVLITCHRRENLGEPLRGIVRALARLAEEFPDYQFLFPVHPNPAVREVVYPALEKRPNVSLVEPLSYDQFLRALVRSHLVLSDSGGVQEEATALGKPVLLLREETERPEGIQAGVVLRVGTDEQRILREARRLLSSAAAWQKMARGSKVFGDGRSAARIVRRLERELAESANPNHSK